MTTWRLDLAWDGRAYQGWQRQPQGRTIQGEVEQALGRVLGGQRVRVQASGRTDAGVHARQQVAVFETSVTRSSRRIVGGLNFFLPDDIAVLAARVVSPGFNPRLWTTGKVYRYRVLNRMERCPFRREQTWHIERRLDVAAMAAAGRALQGRHDFSSFRARGCTAASPVRTVNSVSVRAQEDEVQLDFVGHGFLQHQVRIMTGSLVAVGLGRWPAPRIQEILTACDRSLAGETAPAMGLWLQSVSCGDGPRAT